PLGMLANEEKAIDASVRAKLEPIARLDLTLEKKALVARHPDERPFVDLLERELKRFLSLPLLVPRPDYPFAPSVRVDELWHDLILNTPKYRQLCDKVYGTYLDHTPNQEEFAKELTYRAGEIAEYTNSTLVKYYGILEEAIWGTEIVRPCYPPPAN